MLRFLPYLLKSLWGHRARTLLTVSGSAAAMFVVAFVQAARDGLDAMTRGARAERTLIVYQANRYCPFSSRLPEDYGRQIVRLKGVREVAPTQVYVNNCKASLDIVLFHGMPLEKLRSMRDLHVEEGSWQDFEKRSDGALAGQALARRRGLKPGQPFSIGGVTVMVGGVFRSANTDEENVIYTHLPFLQRAMGGTGVGVVTQFEVHIEEDASPEAVARAIDAQFRGDRVATDTRSRGAFQQGLLADLAELIAWSSWLGFACVLVVLSLVATTTVMSVQDRSGEHAVLQAIGFCGVHIFLLVLAESVLLSVAGCLLGTGAAQVWLALRPISLGTEGAMLVLRPAVGTALAATGLSLVVGLLAGLVPAWRASRLDIVQSLRQG